MRTGRTNDVIYTAWTGRRRRRVSFFIPDVKQTDSLLEGDEAEDPSHNSCLRRCLRRGSGGGCRARCGCGRDESLGVNWELCSLLCVGGREMGGDDGGEGGEGALSHAVEEEQYMKKWGIPCTAVLLQLFYSRIQHHFFQSMSRGFLFNPCIAFHTPPRTLSTSCSASEALNAGSRHG